MQTRFEARSAIFLGTVLGTGVLQPDQWPSAKSPLTEEEEEEEEEERAPLRYSSRSSHDPLA